MHANIIQGIATGNKKSTVPWAQILSNPEGFFDRKYLPADERLREPSKLKKVEVAKLLDFWKERQEKKEVPVFQFHHTMNWQGVRVEAADEEEDVANAESPSMSESVDGDGSADERITGQDIGDAGAMQASDIDLFICGGH